MGGAGKDTGNLGAEEGGLRQGEGGGGEGQVALGRRGGGGCVKRSAGMGDP
jgi:hypothetical protein